MGVDYYICSNCGDTFPDAGDYVTCEGCSEHWCSHECAEEDGHVLEHCAIHPELDDRDLMEEYRGEHCDYGDCTFCDHYVSESCGYCRGEKFDESFLLEKAIELLGIDEETFLKIVISERRGDDNWINRMRKANTTNLKYNIRFMLNNCPRWFFSTAQKNCNSQMKSINECIACWHEPFKETSE